MRKRDICNIIYNEEILQLKRKLENAKQELKKIPFFSFKKKKQQKRVVEYYKEKIKRKLHELKIGYFRIEE